MPQLRKQVYTSSSHRDAFEQIGYLEALYLKTFGRKLATDLYFTSQGDPKGHPVYGVTAYYEDTAAARDEVDWMETVLP